MKTNEDGRKMGPAEREWRRALHEGDHFSSRGDDMWKLEIAAIAEGVASKVKEKTMTGSYKDKCEWWADKYFKPTKRLCSVCRTRGKWSITRDGRMTVEATCLGCGNILRFKHTIAFSGYEKEESTG